MKYIYFLLTSILLICSIEISANNMVLGKELGKAIGEDMKIKYTCQKYIGGLEPYFIAKKKVIEYFSGNSGVDKSKAVEVVADLETNLIRNASHEKLDIKFDKHGTTEENRKNVCKELVKKSEMKIQRLSLELEDVIPALE